jgi:hypothetical protein
MKWTGSPTNLGLPVFNEAHRINDAFLVPLDPPELAGIARSVERYRRKWVKRGQFGALGDAERTNWGRERGIRSGLARRKRTQDRDRAIVQAVTGGQSQRQVAREIGLDEKTTRHIMDRDAPLFARSAPLTVTRPWEAEGVSRRTWERRRDASAERTKQVS